MQHEGGSLRVGLLVLAALAVLAAGIFLIGEQNNLFQSKNHYKIRLPTVAGLQSGNPVQLNGVNVGRVRSIRLPQDPGESRLEVTISVDKRFDERIRADSEARIKTLGLLGDKFIELTSGSPDVPRIERGGEIQAAAATDVDRLLASGEDVVENIVSISVSLREILTRMESGQGLLGELMRPRQPGEPSITETMQTLLDTIDRAGRGIEEGKGPIGRLLNDEALGNRLAQAVERFDNILAMAEEGEGLVAALLHDPDLRLRVEETLTNIESATTRFDGVAEQFESGDGLLPKLLNDEAFANAITEELQSLLERLDHAVRRFGEGDGTVAKLLEDPSVYEALNDVIIGVNESKLLRWLIRNRQKKGIEKRYRDETSGLPPAKSDPTRVDEPDHP